MSISDILRPHSAELAALQLRSGAGLLERAGMCLGHLISTSPDRPSIQVLYPSSPVYALERIARLGGDLGFRATFNNDKFRPRYTGYMGAPHSAELIACLPRRQASVPHQANSARRDAIAGAFRNTLRIADMVAKLGTNQIRLAYVCNPAPSSEAPDQRFETRFQVLTEPGMADVVGDCLQGDITAEVRGRDGYATFQLDTDLYTGQIIVP